MGVMQVQVQVGENWVAGERKWMEVLKVTPSERSE